MTPYAGKQDGIAVIVPTLGRPERALRLHEALHALEPEPDQLVFVFQDAAELAWFMDRISCSAECGTLCQIRSLTAARNHGLRRTRCTTVAFIDDDCVPLSKDWLKHLTDPLKDPNIGLVTGPVREWETASAQKSWLPGGYYLIPLILEPVGNHLGATPRRCHTIVGGNCAGRTEELLGVQGFPEEISSPGLYEDIALSLRLRRSTGKSVWFAPKAGIRHDQSMLGGMRDHVSNQTSADYIIAQRRQLLYLLYGDGPSSRLRLMTYRLMRRVRRPLNGSRSRGLTTGRLKGRQHK